MKRHSLSLQDAHDLIEMVKGLSLDCSDPDELESWARAFEEAGLRMRAKIACAKIEDKDGCLLGVDKETERYHTHWMHATESALWAIDACGECGRAWVKIGAIPDFVKGWTQVYQKEDGPFGLPVAVLCESCMTTLDEAGEAGPKMKELLATPPGSQLIKVKRKHNEPARTAKNTDVPRG